MELNKQQADDLETFRKFSLDDIVYFNDVLFPKDVGFHAELSRFFHREVSHL